MTELDKAEQFKRLFVDPAVDAMCEKMKAQLAPIIEKLDQQAVVDVKQNQRLDALESKQWKALVGFGVYASVASVAVGAGWDWLKRKVFG